MKFLVVEDDQAIRDVLEQALSVDGGVVDAEEDGEAGLMRAMMTDYDLIILDVNLPNRSGWEIAEQVVKRKKTPIIFLTARDTTADIVKGLDIGADDYLVKPFHIDELKARVRLVLRKQARSGELVVDLPNGCNFNTGTRDAYDKDGEKVPLTQREITLLELFVLNKGKTLTKDWLLERILSDELEVDNPGNLIEVSLYRLRKKLGANVIVTRRGVGYELGR